MIALVDCGAHDGRSIDELLAVASFDTVYAFEPNPALFPILSANTVHLHNQFSMNLYEEAVWISSGEIELYLGHSESATVLRGKLPHPLFGTPIDYDSPIKVRSIGFSDWLRTTFTDADTVVIKMDIEGAEYAVLQQMIEGGTLGIVSSLYIEWHEDRITTIPRDMHDQIVATVSQQITVLPWK